MQRYNPKEIEPKWQKKWEADKIYQAAEDRAKPKKYVLEYFPYPSGAAMHVGHVRNYTIGDATARYNRMNGYNVLHPMGWDAFGLPAENYAIKNKVSPRQAIDENTARFRKQLMQMGFSYDWSREIDSTDPKYYKWTQWFFLLLFKRGLAYQKEALVNWDPVEKTVLANEQVIDGKGERSGAVVEKKSLKQWFFRITDYADRLLDDLDDLNWSQSIKTMQRNWIGRSKGAEIDFEIAQAADQPKPNFVILHGFTGRADQNFIPWLKKTLEAKGYTVQAPQMPDTEDPKQDEQVEYVLKNCTLDENTVLIGHSLGGAVAMKILEKLDKNIKELLLVAPAVEPSFSSKKRIFWDNFDFTYDYEKISRRAGKILILSDNAEAEYREQYLVYLSEKLGCPLYKVGAADRHFIASVEPSILEILQPGLKVFTTRPDTLFGATFMVLAPEHPLVGSITAAEQRAAVEDYVKATQSKSDIERQDTDREKTGVFTGAYAINPANDEKIPIWIADYVLSGYGTGAVMAVPAHDERDHEFAKKFDLPIVRVVKNDAPDDECTHDEGVMINSGDYDGLSSEAAREKIVADLEKKGAAQEVVNYKLRDWLISRQRYWGAPIPIIHCPKDGAVPVPESQLPVVLPEVKSYEPSGDGRSPLANVPEFVNTKCPKCGGPGQRETDTMDGFACSSWYFLRFADPHNDKAAFARDKADFWLPVDDYIGGAEHAVMHLLYARFWTKVMYDEKLIDFSEPFTTLRNQGMILAPDGQKMSKSKNNTIEPDEIIKQGYGADSIRLMELFIGPWNQAANWSVSGVAGTNRFLQRVWTLSQEFMDSEGEDTGESADIRRAVHKTIKKVTQDLQDLSFNTAIAAQMELVNELYRIKAADGYASKDWPWALEILLKLLAPFAPHIAEELWSQAGHEGSVHTAGWPAYEKQYLVEGTVTIAIQVNGKLRGEVQVPADASEEDVVEAAGQSAKVASHLKDKSVRKTIYIPGKLVNFVV